MVTKGLHLNFIVGSPWGFRFVAAVNKAVQEGKVPRPINEQAQMPLYIATRLDMLPRIVRRINQECKLLYEAVKNHAPRHVFTSAREAYAFSVDEDLKYNLMIDIDSLIFEMHSCCEITMRLIWLVHDHVGRRICKEDIGKTVKNVLSSAGLDTKWFVELDNNRNFFIHQGTPYIAVDLTEEEKDIYDVLVMKENLHEFTDTEKFIRLSDIERILRGFIPAMPTIEKYLVSLYNSL